MKIDQSLPLEYSTQQNQLNILGFWVFKRKAMVID